MKKLYTIFIIAFAAVIVLPLAMLDTREEVISEIDNRRLADLPHIAWRKAKEDGQEFDFFGSLPDFLSDRIGFRKQFISGYLKLFGDIFGEIEHPSYTYGRDGYIFFRQGESPTYGGFHDDYVSMMAKIKTYCEERGTPCYFMFEPSKTTVLEQYLPMGLNYNSTWVDEMLQKMRDAGIRVVDNTELLSLLTSEGVAVFNKQYDPGHWNDLGAYYGVNNLLRAMEQDGLKVAVNRIEDFDVSQELQTTLQTSEFPIREMTPRIDTHEEKLKTLSEIYVDELEIDKEYPHFVYYINNEKKDTPKLLMFQGSYINGKGYRFLANAFGEYVGVHDYENTINFSYYYNVFKPDVVVVEVAEYACNSNYFSLQAMEDMRLNPALSIDNITDEVEMEEDAILIKKMEKALSIIRISDEACQKVVNDYYLHPERRAYLIVNSEIFDMRPAREDGYAYECTIDNRALGMDPQIAVVLGDEDTTVKLSTPARWKQIVYQRFDTFLDGRDFFQML